MVYSYFNLRCRIKASRLRDIHKAAATSPALNPNISLIQVARHRRFSLYGRGIVNVADSYSLRSHIPLRSCLVGLRHLSDNVNWNSCIMFYQDSSSFSIPRIHRFLTNQNAQNNLVVVINYTMLRNI